MPNLSGYGGSLSTTSSPDTASSRTGGDTFADDFRMSYTYWDACCTSNDYGRPYAHLPKDGYGRPYAHQLTKDSYGRPYAHQLSKDGYGRPYAHQLPHYQVKESCLSGGYLTPQWPSNTIETRNSGDTAPVEVTNSGSSTDSSQTGSVKSRDTHAQEHNTENRRLSNRFFPRLFVDEKNHPNAANAPNQRISRWLSSADCGIKKFGGFINPPHQQNWKS